MSVSRPVLGLHPFPKLGDCKQVSKDLHVHGDVYARGDNSTLHLGYYTPRGKSIQVIVREIRTAVNEQEFSPEELDKLYPQRDHVDEFGFPVEKLKEKYAERDDNACLAETNSQNVIRWWYSEQIGSYLYIATEVCFCSVADLFPWNSKMSVELEEIRQYFGLTEILHEATMGLAFLHGYQFIHRNIKPSNFLVAKIDHPRKYVIKISDFRKSKCIAQEPVNSGTRGSEGWAAPEALFTGATLTLECDIFVLGCFYFYVLQNGRHPFGEAVQRLSNIINRDYDIYKGHFGVEFPALSLIRQMIQWDPEKRPTVDKILENAYFTEGYPLYDVENCSPGLVVIINQENFHSAEMNRPGSSKDVEALEKTFSSFGLQVEKHSDLEARDLDQILSDIAQRDFSKYNSFVLCLMSHGCRGAVCGIDDKPVLIDDIKLKFDDKTCPGLQGKPKIFIVQACQNDNQGSLVVKPTPATGRAGEHTLTLMATIQGSKATRMISGSPFIQKLCSQLQDEYSTQRSKPKDLHKVMLDVQKEFTETRYQTKDGILIQVPEYRSTLQALIYFKAIALN